MTKVCYLAWSPIANCERYQIDSFDPYEYFPAQRALFPLSRSSSFLKGARARNALFSAGGVDRLYRERNPDYMRMTRDFIDRFRDYDVIVAGINVIHPELLWRELRKPIKILAFIDDPVSSYIYGLPYLWAFDGAFYISTSYIDDMLFKDAFARWGKPSRWYPLTAPQPRPTEISEAFFRNRDLTAVYVGKAYTDKVKRLIELKRHFKKRFSVYGRWSLKGYIGFARALFGRPIFPYRVKNLTNDERANVYWRTKIGFNMNFSEAPFECGNSRTYEVPAHGMLLVQAKSAANGHALIFEPNKEALYYDSINEAIDIIEYYAARDDERVAIAKAGFDRFWRDYQYEDNQLKLLDWALSLRENAQRRDEK
jgi:hypothetical protein